MARRWRRKGTANLCPSSQRRTPTAQSMTGKDQVCRLPMRSNHGHVRAQSLLDGDDDEAVLPPRVMPSAAPCVTRWWP
jgi:hypothetical protein